MSAKEPAKAAGKVAVERAVSTATTAAVASTGVGAPVARVAGEVTGRVATSKPVGRAVKFIAGSVVFVMGLGGLSIMGLMLSIAPLLGFTGAADSALQTCYGSGGAAAPLNEEQAGHVATIVDAVKDRGLGGDDAVILTMAGLAISGLMVGVEGEEAEVPPGDGADNGIVLRSDDVGLFGMDKSWGSLVDREDPAASAGLFLDAMLDQDFRVKADGKDVAVADLTVRAQVKPWLVARAVTSQGFDDGLGFQRDYATAFVAVRAVLVPQPKADDSPSASPPPSPSVETDEQRLAREGIENIAVGLISGPSWVTYVPGLGDSDDSAVVYCDYGSGEEGAAPGPWGGYENGGIPAGVMCPIPWAKHEPLRCDAQAALVQMNQAYHLRFGVNISITDGYRDLATQVRLKREKGRFAATPGKSNHGWGLALDLGGRINSFVSAEHKWMKENAPMFGWHHPAWAAPDRSTPEPWHWEFRKPPSAGGDAPAEATT